MFHAMYLHMIVMYSNNKAYLMNNQYWNSVLVYTDKNSLRHYQVKHAYQVYWW